MALPPELEQIVDQKIAALERRIRNRGLYVKHGKEHLRGGQDFTPALTVEEQDGSPSVRGVRKIKVTNATLTDDGGGVVSLAISSGTSAHDHTTGDGSGVLTADEHDSYSQYAEIAAPTTPAAGKVRIYPKSDGLMYVKDDAGVEREMGTVAHEADTTDAHDASAISILDTAGDFTATDVEGALAELQSDNEAHVTAGHPHDLDDTAVHTTAQDFTSTLKLAKLEIDDANFHLDLVASKPRITLGATQYMEMDRVNYLLNVLDTAAGQITLDIGTPALYLYALDGDTYGKFALDTGVGGFLAGDGGASIYDIGLRRAAAGWFNITTTSSSALRDFGLRYMSMKSSGAITAMTNASAQLEMLATDKGFKPNAVTTAQRDAISSPADGLVVYNTDNDRLEVYDTTVTAWAPVTQRLTMIELTIDGGGSAITTGVKLDLVIPFDCVPTAWDLLADQSGSIVIDIWKDTYANYPPTVADAITGTEGKPTISSATKAQDTAWAPGAWTRGNTLRFNVDSITTVTRVTLAIWVRKT